MRRLTPDFIEQVRLANDIVDIIGEDTMLKRSGSGSNYLGSCPFPSHKDKTPSFSVSQDRQLYNCFGCQASGNIYTYLQAKKGVHFMDAVKELAQRAGLSFPSTETDKQDKAYLYRKKLIAINVTASQFYHQTLQNLPISHPVRKYLNDRDISKDTVKEFQLGYAPSEWTSLVSYLKKQGLSLEHAKQVGLVAYKNGRFYDALRDRIIFPIFSSNGREVLGFGARALGDQMPKYINSPESDIFHKGSLFYGWHKSTVAMRSKEKALVVEGYTDYLSLYQRGLCHVVAVLGTALTPWHARWLSRYSQEVVLCFDADSAGRNSAERSLGTLLSHSLAPKMVQFPDEEWDPDSFIRAKGVSTLEKLIQQAPDLFLQVLAGILEPLPDISSRLLKISKIAQLLVQVKSPELKKYYTSRVLDSFGTADKWAMQALSKAIKRELSQNKPSLPVDILESSPPSLLQERRTSAPKVSLATAPKAELHLLILALNDFDSYLQVITAEVLDKIQDPGILHLFRTMTQAVKKEKDLFMTFIDEISYQVLEPHQLQKSSHDYLAGLSSPTQLKNYIQDCVAKIEQKYQLLQLKKAASDVHNINKQDPKHLQNIVNLARKSKYHKQRGYYEK